MGLVTGLAGNAVGVVGCVDLREALRARGAGGMAADAEDGGVGLTRIDGRIVGMFSQWTVAGFAIDVRVLAGTFGLGDVGVAGFAGLMAGEVSGVGGDFGNGVAAVVSELAEAVRDDGGAQHEEEKRTDRVDCSESKEMTRVPEDLHGIPALPGRCRNARDRVQDWVGARCSSYLADGREHLSVPQITTRLRRELGARFMTSLSRGGKVGRRRGRSSL